MRKGMKTFLMICGIVVGVGLLLSILGFVLGGVKGLAGVEERIPWISFGGGGQKESQNISTEKFSSVNIDCDMENVEFVEAKEYGVAVRYDKKLGSPKVKAENNLLTIEPAGKRHGSINLSLFGIRDYADMAVTVYYPKGAKFDRVEIKSDMGDTRLSNIKARDLDLNVSTGDIKLSGIDVGNLKIKADMGSVEASGIKTGGADINMSSGELDLSGSFAGTTSISTDMGDCTLNTNLPKDSYSIEARNDMGDCEIDGTNVGTQYTVANAAAKNHLKLECSSGDMEINFQ